MYRLLSDKLKQIDKMKSEMKHYIEVVQNTWVAVSYSTYHNWKGRTKYEKIVLMLVKNTLKA